MADAQPTIPTESRPHDALRLPVDPEHAGLRLLVIAVFLGLAVLFYTLLDGAMPQAGPVNILALVAALLVSALLIQNLDGALKSRWPSGRRLEVTSDAVRILLKDSVQHQINAAQHVNVLTWRFEIPRRARAPKGWFVVALSLEQDGTHIPVYTFVSPDDLPNLPLSKRFTLLKNSRQQAADQRAAAAAAAASATAARQDLRLAGEERRLRNAESFRWEHGAEMKHEDFVTYVQTLQARFPSWMPDSA